jgi:hypothetical protein
MLMDKIEMLKMESCQKEALAITHEFRRALLKHFDVVTANSMRLINTRWGDENGTV